MTARLHYTPLVVAGVLATAISSVAEASVSHPSYEVMSSGLAANDVRATLARGAPKGVCEHGDVSETEPTLEELEGTIVELREEVARLKDEIRRLRRETNEVPPHYL